MATIGRRAPHPRGALLRSLMLYFGCKKANFWKTIWAKVSIQSELRISRYKGKGARAESRSAKTERDREIDPISEGLSPLRHHGGHGPEGKPSSHLGGGQGRRGRGISPLSPGGTGTPPGPSCVTAIYTNTSVSFTNIFITFPHLSIAVHSPATRRTLYLNMVLYTSYYYPMMCCHPMMLE